MQLYHSTINGNKNRFKLRVRFYDENQGLARVSGNQAANEQYHQQETRWSETRRIVSNLIGANASQ